MCIAFNRQLKMVLSGSFRSLIMAAVLLLPLTFYSQKVPFLVAENINTRVTALNGIPDKIVGCYDHAKIYTTTANGAMGGTLSIYEYDLTQHAASSFTIKKNKTNGSIFGSMILAISVQGDKLYILNSNYLHILKKEGSHLNLYKSLANTASFNTIHKLGKNQLLLSVNYNFHPSDEPHKHTWAKLNINTDSLYPESYREEDNAKFSYFTNSWLSTYKGLIAYSKTSEYVIKFHDDNFAVIDSINTHDFDSNQALAKFVPDGNEYSADNMKRIGTASDTLLHRIEKIFLIDSTKLLVTIKQPRSNYYRFDIWVKNDKEWKRSVSRQLESNYLPYKRYTDDNNQIHGFYGNHAIIVSDEKKHFYNYYYPYRNNIVTESFNMEKDLIEPLNDLTRKNQLYFGIRKIEIVTD